MLVAVEVCVFYTALGQAAILPNLEGDSVNIEIDLGLDDQLPTVELYGLGGGENADDSDDEDDGTDRGMNIREDYIPATKDEPEDEPEDDQSGSDSDE